MKMSKFAMMVLASAALAAMPVSAQNKPPEHALPPGADAAAFKPLPERKDVVSWKLLGQVELVKAKDRYVAQFSKSVTDLNSKEVQVQGFMMPLEVGEKQSHFVLTAMPQTCSFCLPGGPEQMVEVRTKTAVKYTFEPVVLKGKLAVLKDDPTGVFYRLTDAVPAK
jgi:uncharacterized protein